MRNQYSREFNRKLRIFGTMGLKEEDIKIYNVLMEIKNSNNTSQNFLVHRFVKNDYIESVFNFNPNNNIYFNLMMIRSQIGTRKVENGFMSYYMTDKHIVREVTQLEIKYQKEQKHILLRIQMNWKLFFFIIMNMMLQEQI